MAPDPNIHSNTPDAHDAPDAHVAQFSKFQCHCYRPTLNFCPVHPPTLSGLSQHLLLAPEELGPSSTPNGHWTTNAAHQQVQTGDPMSLPPVVLNEHDYHSLDTILSENRADDIVPRYEFGHTPSALRHDSNVPENTQLSSCDKLHQEGNGETEPQSVQRRPFQCTEEDCQNKVGFDRNADLERHQRTKHSDLRPFACGFCLNRFKRKDHLKTHEAVVHLTRGHQRLSGTLQSSI